MDRQPPLRYEASTQGIRVRVRPSFLLAESEPGEDTYVFEYLVEMANTGHRAAQLLFRHWYIHDAAGEDTEVDGEGVVGEQPVLLPGSAHEYRSYCVLRSPAGYMEGYYTFREEGGSLFQVRVPRFVLAAPFPGMDAAPDVMN